MFIIHCLPSTPTPRTAREDHEDFMDTLEISKQPTCQELDGGLAKGRWQWFFEGDMQESGMCRVEGHSQNQGPRMRL